MLRVYSWKIRCETLLTCSNLIVSQRNRFKPTCNNPTHHHHHTCILHHQHQVYHSMILPIHHLVIRHHHQLHFISHHVHIRTNHIICHHKLVSRFVDRNHVLMFLYYRSIILQSNIVSHTINIH